MRTIFVALCFAVPFLLGAPAQAADAAIAKRNASPALEARKKIALITDIGGSFTVRKIGTMVFGNEEASVPVDGWGIDTLVVSKTAAILKGYFSVVALKLSPEGRAKLADAPGSLFGDRAAYLCKVLRKEAPGQSFAYYLRITPGQKRYRNTNQTLAGLGIVQGQDLFTSNTFVHALFAIEVLNGQNCDHIRVEEPSAETTEFFDAIRGPNLKVEDSWMPRTLSSAAQDTRLRDTVKKLIEQGLMQSLPHLFAIGH